MNNKFKVVAIIQARMGSTRLPGKMLMRLGDKPVIFYVVNRVRQISLVDEVWIATTTNIDDDKIVNWAKEEKINFFRGSENDVLDRYYQTAKKSKADVVVRITGDCPLIDPDISNIVIKRLLEGNAEYTTNRTPPTYPDGMDTEAFYFSVLEKVWKEAGLPSDREHVTTYIWENPEIFKIENVFNEKDLSAFRLTLDTKEDFNLLEKIISICEKNGKKCLMNEVLELLEKHPEWKSINSKYERNEGYIKSVKID